MIAEPVRKLFDQAFGWELIFDSFLPPKKIELQNFKFVCSSKSKLFNFGKVREVFKSFETITDRPVPFGYRFNTNENFGETFF